LIGDNKRKNKYIADDQQSLDSGVEIVDFLENLHDQLIVSEQNNVHHPEYHDHIELTGDKRSSVIDDFAEHQNAEVRCDHRGQDKNQI
jgi:hypothetical protein